MNAAICPRCTAKPRVVGWPYCHECARAMSDRYGAIARKDQALAECDPRGKEPLDYATS